MIPGFPTAKADEPVDDKSGNVVREGATLAEVVKRPQVEVMKLRDYDHDGLAAEFIFPVGYVACGQSPSVLVGISRDKMHLHELGVTMTYRWEWDRILAARGKSIDVELHVCGDHGGGGDYAILTFDPVHGMHLRNDPRWECSWDDKTGFKKQRVKKK